MMEKVQLKLECERWRRQFYHGQVAWSIAHHTAHFGSIVASLTAGALLQVQSEHLKMWASLLTAVAAALTGMAAAGGFERKWRSNRLSRSKIDGLLLDLECHASDVDSINRQLKDVILLHDQAVVLQEPVK